MKNLKQMTVGEIVAEDYRASQVFRSKGLDFCCGGGKSLEDACSSKNIDIEQVVEELSLLQHTISAEPNYNEWGLDFLVDYIEQNHHRFVRKMLPEIYFYAEKVAGRHGVNHPELLEIVSVVRELGAELDDHLTKEETGVFPAIKELVRNHEKIQIGQNTMETLEDEHETAGELMARIEKLTNGFTPPEGACASYQILFKNLEAFSADLHKHVHLENNILFPKALALENRIN